MISSCLTGLTREDLAIYMTRTTRSQRVRYLDAHIADYDCMERMARLTKQEARQRAAQCGRAVSTARAIGILLCVLSFPVMSLMGCASNSTVLRIGLHADITDVVNGCDRKLDAHCGLKGPRDIAVIELLYIPGVKFDKTFTPYVSWLHKSHYSAGFPLNNKFEQIVDAPGGGGFIQFGSKK